LPWCVYLAVRATALLLLNVGRFRVERVAARVGPRRSPGGHMAVAVRKRFGNVFL